jgi:hypothetical protein
MWDIFVSYFFFLMGWKYVNFQWIILALLVIAMPCFIEFVVGSTCASSKIGKAHNHAMKNTILFASKIVLNNWQVWFIPCQGHMLRTYGAVLVRNISWI